jgi:hypothetical protein
MAAISGRVSNEEVMVVVCAIERRREIKSEGRRGHGQKTEPFSNNTYIHRFTNEYKLTNIGVGQGQIGQPLYSSIPGLNR